jgi:hypothetical protein
MREPVEAVPKLTCDGHLTRDSKLAVLTDSNVRCVPVLEDHAS